MEGFVPAQFDEILGLDEKHLRSVVLATAGYRSGKDPAAVLRKVRFDTSDLFVHVSGTR
jgi:nitroreductase